MGRPKIIDQKEYAEILGIIVQAGKKPISTPEIREQLGGKISSENLKNKLTALRKHPYFGALIHEEIGKGRNPSKYKIPSTTSGGNYGKYLRSIPQELYPQLTLRLIEDSYQQTLYALKPRVYEETLKILEKSSFLKKEHLALNELRVLPALTRIAAKTLLAKSSS